MAWRTGKTKITRTIEQAQVRSFAPTLCNPADFVGSARAAEGLARIKAATVRFSIPFPFPERALIGCLEGLSLMAEGCRLLPRSDKFYVVEMATPLRGQTQPAGRIYSSCFPLFVAGKTVGKSPKPPQIHDNASAITQTLKAQPQCPQRVSRRSIEGARGLDLMAR